MSGISRLDGTSGPATPSTGGSDPAPNARDSLQDDAARLQRLMKPASGGGDQAGTDPDAMPQPSRGPLDGDMLNSAADRFRHLLDGAALPRPEAGAGQPSADPAAKPLGEDVGGTGVPGPERQQAVGPGWTDRGQPGDVPTHAKTPDLAKQPAMDGPIAPAVQPPQHHAVRPNDGPSGPAAAPPPDQQLPSPADPELQPMRGADLAGYAARSLPGNPDRPPRRAGTDDEVPAAGAMAGASRGDAILANLGVSAPEAPAAPAPVRAPDLQQLVQVLADRVLVGQRADGTQEVRVTLRGDVLGQTEVRIARQDGGIQFHIVPATPEASELLLAHGTDLARTLSDRLEGRVTVELAPTRPASDASGQGAGGQERGQDPRRSRGFDDILSYVAE